MRAYASVTTSQNIIKELGRLPWRWMATPFISHAAYTAMLKTGWSYALDSGAWGFRYSNENKVRSISHEMGVTRDFKARGGNQYDDNRFMWMVDKYGLKADFIVVPDVVGDREATLEKAESWTPRLRGLKLVIAVQDRMLERDIAPYLKKGVGIFIGGSTRWKVSKIPYWAGVARKWNVMCHCGRVNTERRIEMCRGNGIDSFDGSGPARWLKRSKELTDYLISKRGETPVVTGE